MPDELNAQQAFLTWEESAAVLHADASQGIARAQSAYLVVKQNFISVDLKLSYCKYSF